MPEDFSHVRPGQPVGINAATWNVMLDSAAAFKREGGRADGVNPFSRSPAKVRVRNDSGATRNILDVLIVENTPAITPTDNAEGFKVEPILVGTAVGSDLTKAFVVLAQPLVSGAVGWAHCAGMFAARINVNDASHTYADLKTSDSTQLDSKASGGQARIIYKESGTGTKLAVVQYPVGGSSTVDLRYDAATHWVQLSYDGGDTWENKIEAVEKTVVTNVTCNGDGTISVTTDTIYVFE